MALRRVIEMYTHNVRFCLIANQATRIIDAIQSRCIRFRFGPMPDDALAARLEAVAQFEGVQLDASGRDAIVKLASGDMRQMLNLLQQCALAHADERISCDIVYQAAGKPLPSEIEKCYKALLEMPFQPCFEILHRLLQEQGLTLGDLVTGIHACLLRDQKRVPRRALALLFDHLSTVEHALAEGATEKLQLGRIVGAFIFARQTIRE